MAHVVPLCCMQQAALCDSLWVQVTLTGHTDKLTSLALYPDTGTVVTGSEDKTCRHAELRPASALGKLAIQCTQPKLPAMHSCTSAGYGP